MPIYEYVCNSCGKLNDVLQKVNDPPPAKCDGCGAEGGLTRIVSRTSFVLKGGGWYSDLYSSSSANKGSSSSSGSSSESKKSDAGSSSGGSDSTSSTSKKAAGAD